MNDIEKRNYESKIYELEQFVAILEITIIIGVILFIVEVTF